MAEWLFELYEQSPSQSVAIDSEWQICHVGCRQSCCWCHTDTVYGMYVYMLVCTGPVVQEVLLLCIQAGEYRQWLVPYLPDV